MVLLKIVIVQKIEENITEDFFNPAKIPLSLFCVRHKLQSMGPVLECGLNKQ